MENYPLMIKVMKLPIVKLVQSVRHTCRPDFLKAIENNKENFPLELYAMLSGKNNWMICLD